MAGTEDIESSVTFPRHRKQLSDTDLEIKKVDEDSLRRNQATTWLRKTVGVVAAKDLPAEPSEEDFKLGLRSGNILCNVLNKMPPGSVPKVARSSSEDGENLINFLVVIEEMGFPSFDPCDLDPEGHSSRVVDCVLALKSYSERRGESASRRFSGSFKSSPSGMLISRKNSEPVSISRSHSLGSETLDKWDQSNIGSDLNGTNSELDSSPLYMLVCDLLADKEEEEIPTIVENLLNKVTEEFERRFEEETKKASIIATQFTKDENRFIQPESPKAQLEDTKRSFSDVYSEKEEEEEATPDTKKEEGNSGEDNKAINQQESGNKGKFSKQEGSNKQDGFTGLKEKFTKKQEDTSRELERNKLEEKARKEQEERSKEEERKKLEEKSKKEEEERRKEEERNKLEEKARIEQEERSKLEEENKLKEKARMEEEERRKEEERNKLQEKARKEEEERRIAEENKRLKEKARREQALRKRREEERRRKREEKKKLKEKARKEREERRKEREERRKEREERRKEREERRKEERKKKLEERARKEAELKQKNTEYYKIKEAIKEQQERTKEIEQNSLKEIASKEEEIRSHEKEYNTLKERISSKRVYVEQQHKDLQGLKNTLSSAKSDLKSMQTNYQEEFNNLGTHVRNLTQAAAGYKKVLEENRKLYNQVQDLKGNIRVYCRVRPLLPGSENNTNIVDYIDNGTITVIAPLKTGNMGRRSFFLNKVFGSSATQEEVFSDTQPLIRSVLDGFNVCIFAYGQTGAGKTYTLSGPDDLTPETMGVNYRALDDLFEISEQRKNLMAYEISVNMLSICDEDIRDLLVTDGSDKSLEIRSGTSNGINVPDANRVPVTSTDEVKNLMNLGQKNQAAMNDPSTSSHCCLTVHVFGKDLTSRATVRGCMHLVDLAGSENTSKSLSALGDVIAALSHKSSNVPYKNSKLTQFLQDALGAQAKTLMFVHICPDTDAIGETLNTLKFGERVSMDSGKDTAEARDLKEQIANLKAALAKKDVGGLDQDSMVNSPRAGDKQNGVCDDNESVEESKPKSSGAKQEKAPPSRTAVTKKPTATASTASKTAKAPTTVDPKKKKVAK